MIKESAVVLKFRESGGSYARAKEVAAYMGLDMKSYLLKCIEEGHKKLKSGVDSERDAIPAYLRRGPAE